jgi:hypothetical protein
MVSRSENEEHVAARLLLASVNARREIKRVRRDEGIAR